VLLSKLLDYSVKTDRLPTWPNASYPHNPCSLLACLQSYVAQLLPASSPDPNALSMAALQGATVVQINSSAAVLALAKSAGFDTVAAFMPGLQMFWDDVSQYHGCESGVCRQPQYAW
jgi:hypothetical protein